MLQKWILNGNGAAVCLEKNFGAWMVLLLGLIYWKQIEGLRVRDDSVICRDSNHRSLYWRNRMDRPCGFILLGCGWAGGLNAPLFGFEWEAEWAILLGWNIMMCYWRKVLWGQRRWWAVIWWSIWFVLKAEKDWFIFIWRFGLHGFYGLLPCDFNARLGPFLQPIFGPC